jgi:acyl homoserine lactone synthase
MIQEISGAVSSYFHEELDQMHKIRYRVFKERLDWQVNVRGNLEIDHFDDLNPVYLLRRNVGGMIDGCVRLLPSQGPNMLRDVFPFLCNGKIPSDPRIWESSRFCLDTSTMEPGKAATRTLSNGTFELLLGVIETGLAHGLTHILTVTDARMERILARAGWPLERIGEPTKIGETIAVAGLLETSREALGRVRSFAGISAPVLWRVAIQEAA